MAEQRITILDIAKKAGVNGSTVSLALRNDRRIRPTTRQRILEIAGQMNYVPNRMARSLGGGKTRMIGVLLTDLDNSFFAPALEEMQAAGHAGGYDLMVDFSLGDAHREIRAVRQFCESRVDGVIWAPAWGNDERRAGIAAILNRASIPFVLLAMEDPAHVFGHQVGARFDALTVVADYLLEKGHRRIGVACSTTAPGMRGHIHRRRQALLREYLAKVGHPLRDADVYDTRRNLYGGVALAAEISRLPAQDRPTAIIATDDMIAQALVAGFDVVGMAVPQEISVIGCDGSPRNDEALVPLTTLSLEIGPVANRAIKLLLDLTRGSLPRQPLRSIEISPRLIERASVKDLRHSVSDHAGPSPGAGLC